MNCIEKLEVQQRTCEPCKAMIIVFRDLPEHEKFNFDSYDDNNDYILHCEKCETFLHLNSDTL